MIAFMVVQNVTVIGTGAMGSGIAYVTAVAGMNVTLVDQKQEFIDKGMERIRKMLMDGIDKKKMSPAEGEKVFHRFKTELDMAAAVKDADLVIEAVYENMDVKKEIFNKCSASAPSDALLASNTSTLSITEIASVVEKPERVLGLHFFNPPSAMKLVEVIRGEKTSDTTIEAALAYVDKLNKTAVVAKDSPGFLVNRVLVPVLNEAVKLLDEGVATKDDIDKALVLGANFPVGPLKLADFVGLDVALASCRTLERTLGEAYTPSPSLVRLVDEGKLGIKTGEGFYKY